MIPLRDDVPSRSVPIVNYAIIALTAIAFFAQLQETPGEPSLIDRFGLIPARITDPGREITIREFVPRRTPEGIRRVVEERPAGPPAVPPLMTLLTCIFLHGGWLHFIANMWFLYLFGDNVEDVFGHVGYLIFYLAMGVLASVAHLVSDPGSAIPTIGASGAIAGVMGSYFLLYPRASVLTLVPIFFFLYVVVLPAPLFLGIWFLLQFLQGAVAITGEQQAGVAWWAHIGGFVFGVVVTWILGRVHWLRPKVQERIPVRRREPPRETHPYDPFVG